MISLPAGARVVRFYEAEMPKEGRGILYLLSSGLLFEKKGKGARFECGFDILASFEAVKKDRLRVAIRTAEGQRTVDFKIGLARQVEYDISQASVEYAGSHGSQSVASQGGFDQDAHSLSEARWFEENWDDIMKFLKPERAEYLSEFVKSVKVGSPDVDPYLLVVDFENLTYKDFADLAGFLKRRYKDMTDKETGMIIGVFRDFEDFSVRTLEMDVQICKPREPSFKKKGYSLYQFVAIVAKEKFESAKLRESQQTFQNNRK